MLLGRIVETKRKADGLENVAGFLLTMLDLQNQQHKILDFSLHRSFDILM
jgi:hypothetical protein